MSIAPMTVTDIHLSETEKEAIVFIRSTRLYENASVEFSTFSDMPEEVKRTKVVDKTLFSAIPCNSMRSHIARKTAMSIFWGT